MAQYGFYFDSNRCTGCRTCEMACKDYKDLEDDFRFRHVYDYEGGSCDAQNDVIRSHTCFVYHLSISCQHCEDPSCMRACPTEAMHKEESTGLVMVDPDKCIGCGYCHMACPYNVPKVDRSKGHSVKCDGCYERVSQGLRPICVESCPLRALDFGLIEDIRKTYDGVDAIAPMPVGDYTHPNIVINPCPDACEPDDKSGFVANPLEVI